MKLRPMHLAAFAIVVFSFLLAYYYYPLMPEKIASHWNSQGLVNGYMSKFWALFLMPIISLFVFALFLAIPSIDPLKKNIESFRKQFDTLIVLIMLFMLYVFALTIFWNLNFEFSMIQFLAPAFGLLFFYIGVLLKHAKQNWFVGIRTPWTLSSEKVWNRTHERGALLFEASAILAALGTFSTEFAIWLVLIPIIASTVYLFVFSYIEFNKEKSEASKTRKRK